MGIQIDPHQLDRMSPREVIENVLSEDTIHDYEVIRELLDDYDMDPNYYYCLKVSDWFGILIDNATYTSPIRLAVECNVPDRVIDLLVEYGAELEGIGSVYPGFSDSYEYDIATPLDVAIHHEQMNRIVKWIDEDKVHNLAHILEDALDNDRRKIALMLFKKGIRLEYSALNTYVYDENDDKYTNPSYLVISKCIDHDLRYGFTGQYDKYDNIEGRHLMYNIFREYVYKYGLTLKQIDRLYQKCLKHGLPLSEEEIDRLLEVNLIIEVNKSNIPKNRMRFNIDRDYFIDALHMYLSMEWMHSGLKKHMDLFPHLGRNLDLKTLDENAVEKVVACMQMMVELGFDINAQDDKGYTMLDYCWWNPEHAIVKYAVELGALTTEPITSNEPTTGKFTYTLYTSGTELPKNAYKHVVEWHNAC